MNNLKVFTNEEFGEVRTAEESGQVLFNASDVASALGYSNPRKAIIDHCKGVTKRDTPTSSGTQEMSYIAESDLYRLIMKSKLPSAEKFEKWVCEEVLPSIRKNGGYITGQEAMTDDELMAKALLVAQNKIAEKDNIISMQGKSIEQMKPKVIFADAVSVSSTSILIGELAKIINQNGVNIGQNRLFDYLRCNQYLISRRGIDFNMPTQKSMDLKLFEIKERTINNPDGSVRITKTVLVTGKGQVYFINKFLVKEGVV